MHNSVYCRHNLYESLDSRQDTWILRNKAYKPQGSNDRASTLSNLSEDSTDSNTYIIYKDADSILRTYS